MPEDEQHPQGKAHHRGQDGPAGPFPGARLRHPVNGGLSTADFLWVIQCRVILDLAEKGPCVLVGRCADYILRDREDVLNVFIGLVLSRFRVPGHVQDELGAPLHPHQAGIQGQVVIPTSPPKSAWRRRTGAAAPTISTTPTGTGG